MKNIIRQLVKFLLFIVTFLFLFIMFSCRTMITVQKPTKDDKKETKFKYYYYEGVKNKLLGKTLEASSYFKKCLELNNTIPSVYYELGQVAYLNGQLSDAEKYVEQAYQMNKNNKWYGTFLVAIYEEANKLDKAKKIIKELLAKDNTQIDLKLELANIYETEGKLQDAIKLFDEIEKQSGVVEDIVLEKAKLYEQLKKYDKSEKEIEKLIKKNPDYTKYYSLLAQLYMSENKLDKAYSTLRRIILIEPTNGKVYMSLSEYYQLVGKTDSAFWALAKAFESSDLDKEKKVEIAYNYIKYYGNDTINFKKIEPLINILTKKYKGDVVSMGLAADFYSQIKDYKKSKKYLNKIRCKDKSNYLVWQQLMFIDNHYNENDSLIVHAREAMDLFPFVSQFYLYAGLGFYREASYDSAIYYLNKGLKLLPDSSLLKSYYFFLAESYYRAHKPDSAFVYYEKLLHISPKDLGAMNNYAFFLALENRDLDKADSLMQIVLKYFPADANYLDTYAWVLYKKKEYAKAQQYIIKALKNGGNANPTILEHAGDIFFKNGNISKAVEYWKKAYNKTKVRKEVLLQKIENRKIIGE